MGERERRERAYWWCWGDKGIANGQPPLPAIKTDHRDTYTILGADGKPMRKPEVPFGFAAKRRRA